MDSELCVLFRLGKTFLKRQITLIDKIGMSQTLRTISGVLSKVGAAWLSKEDCCSTAAESKAWHCAERVLRVAQVHSEILKKEIQSDHLPNKSNGEAQQVINLPFLTAEEVSEAS